MSTKKQLGIWIDYLNAHVMEYTQGFMGKRIIFSGTANEAQHDNGLKTVEISPNTQGKFAAYYNKLCAIIQKYDQVLIFGPANATAELNNIISTDNHFKHIRIDLKTAGKMTDRQQYEFLKAHFSM